MNDSVVSKSVRHLLSELEDKLQEDEEENSRALDEQIKNILLALNTLVGNKLLDKALAISSKRGTIIEYKAVCGRSGFLVQGDSAEYRVLSVGYCSCKNFLLERAGSPVPICKHILAVHLARAQKTIHTVSVSDEEWGKLNW